MINKQTIEKIKTSNDIVEVISSYIDLSKKGKNYWALCPFHEDSNPSMSVSPEKQFYKCFVCQAGGSVINFVTEYEKVPFLKALNILGSKVGIDIKYQENTTPKYTEKALDLVNLMKEASNFFQYSLSTEEGDKAREYLEKRSIDSKIIDKFLIGYAPRKGLLTFLEKKGCETSDIINASLATNKLRPFFRDRLMFSIVNDYGDVVGYSARTLSNDTSKYINSAESKLFNKSAILYNYFNARDIIKKTREVYIAEGFMDVIALHKVGIRNTVAIMGTALTHDHTNKLKGIKVNMFLDSDKAGIKATVKSIKTLLERSIETYVIVNETGLDPDEILAKNGKEELIRISENKISAYEFIYQMHQKQFDINNPLEIEKFIKSFVKYLENASQTVRDFYTNKMVEKLKVSKESIWQYVPSPSHVRPQKSKEKNKFIADERNDAYWLINSIIANPEFSKILITENVIFSDEMLIVIGKYIVSKAKDEVVKSTIPMRKKIQEIQMYNDVKKPINSEAGFRDLIKRVNIETNIALRDKIELKLKRSNDPNEKQRLIKDWTKTKGLLKLMEKRGK